MKLNRRRFIESLATGGALSSRMANNARAARGQQMKTDKTCDVAVIGAGSFGAWTAYQLQRAGRKVILLDAYGPANSRASSGGESRIIRMGYGPDEIYSRWSMRALQLWQEFFQRIRQPLFYPTGVLWLAHDEDQYTRNTLATFEKLGVRHERLSRSELEKRYPQFALGSAAHPASRGQRARLQPVTWGLLEPDSGALLARRAVQAVVHEAVKSGVDYLAAAVAAPTGNGQLSSVPTQAGDVIRAYVFVFACGPWLPKVFPDLLQDRIFPTRQEVFFFGVPSGDSRFAPPAMPTWINLGDETYGIPDLESRGFKIAIDRHGPAFDPDTGKRVVTPDGLLAVREYLAQRFPAMKEAPVVETRVCQYENTSNGDFLIDRHPGFENVWIVGGGSGHGFKHGPVLGEYVAARVIEGGVIEPRFALASKGSVQERSVY